MDKSCRDSRHKRESSTKYHTKAPAGGDFGKDGPTRSQKQTIEKKELDIGCFDEDKERISDDS